MVDEAHCVSEWGHSFRPEYLRLGSVIEELGHPRVLALTATANEAVRAEIATRLNIRNPRIFVHGFDRPNIWMGVETAASENRKRALLLERVKNSARPGIIYATTRRQAHEISDELNNVGISASLYHAGLKKAEREAMQEQFMADKTEVIVATSAFGMGVDKPNVRFVFHYGPPDSLDSYYQEVGRAGRDGEPASTVLFYQTKDLGIHKFFKGTGQIKPEDVQMVLDALQSGDLTTSEIQNKTRLSKIKTTRTLNRLEESGAIERSREGVIHLVAKHASPDDIAAQASQAQSELHEAELARIEQMREYAEQLECRRAYLLRYFGEDAPARCENCDNCLGTGTERAQVIAETKARD